ncbi:MAG: hypothetical protein HOC34_03390 [Candidatus Magasanikbacteria bacterium]|nr:hypothetical protein [Candidatus Magasanikbacteria bacterium]
MKRTEREEYRVISQDKEFHGDILIYEDKVSISTLRGKLISVIIESREIAETMKAFFDLLWQKDSQK